MRHCCRTDFIIASKWIHCRANRFKFDSIERKNGFNNASCLLQHFKEFRADTWIILVAYAAWLRSRFGFATFRI